MDDRTGDEVRTPATVCSPDPRADFLVRVDPTTREFRPITIEDHFSDVVDVVLPDSVESEVRQQFDLARNLMVYAWFVYGFHAVSQLQALRTLELALRRTVPGMAKSKSLKASFDAAFQLGYLSEQDFGPAPDKGSLGRQLRDAEQSIAGKQPFSEREHTIEFIRSFRNDLAHGKPWLMPDTRVVLELVASLISALYRPRTC